MMPVICTMFSCVEFRVEQSFGSAFNIPTIAVIYMHTSPKMYVTVAKVSISLLCVCVCKIEREREIARGSLYIWLTFELKDK